jgi:PAS domain S-box-containing protein
LKTSARFVGELVEKSIFQAELKRKKRLLDDTNRMAKVGGWELDANSLELTWTDETYRIHEFTLDYTPTLEEAINFFHPDDTSKLKSAVQRALAHGEPYDMELRFITAKGKNLWTHSICHPEIVNGKTVKLKGTFQDITEQKKAEEKLKESQERYYRLVEISPDMIAIHLDAIIFYINNAGANMLGFSNPEQIIGKSFLEFLPSSEKEIAKSRMKKLLRSNRRSPLYNHTLIRPNGTKIFVEVVGIPINYKGETTIQINARDVTKRKKTEAILQKTNERLKEKSVALEDMNATLRTLLNKKDQDVKEIEEKIFCNYDSIIMPFFDKLKNSYSNKVQRSLIETIETNLKEIISPFSKKLSDPMINFTPKEIQVASFIKQGITSKEIAQILDCSVRTIDTHRDNIRVKLKIKNKKINLRSYLMILL